MYCDGMTEYRMFGSRKYAVSRGVQSLPCHCLFAWLMMSPKSDTSTVIHLSRLNHLDRTLSPRDDPPSTRRGVQLRPCGIVCYRWGHVSEVSTDYLVLVRQPRLIVPAYFSAYQYWRLVYVDTDFMPQTESIS
jgi:hypothetical protein